MFAFLEKDSFPWWYPVLKWGVPLGLAAASGIGTGMLLTGSLGMPAFFGMLRWAPAFYASLEGVSSLAVLGMATSVTASTVGVLSAFILRGSVLFPLAETIAINSQRTSQTMLSVHTQERNHLVTMHLKAERTAQLLDQNFQGVTKEFNLFKGAAEALKPRATTGAAAPTPIHASNDTPKPEEAAGKRAKI